MSRRKIAPALEAFLSDPEYPNHGTDADGGPTRIEAARRELRAVLAVVRAAQRFEDTWRNKRPILDDCYDEAMSVVRAVDRLPRAPGSRGRRGTP